MSTSNKGYPWLCAQSDFWSIKELLSLHGENILTYCKSIKQEAERRKFAIFKQIDRARAGEGPGKEHREPGREKTDAVKGTESDSENHGWRQELIEERERKERTKERLV